MPTHSGYKWTVTADVESLAWDPHSENSFVVCDLASKDGYEVSMEGFLYYEHNAFPLLLFPILVLINMHMQHIIIINYLFSKRRAKFALPQSQTSLP